MVHENELEQLEAKFRRAKRKNIRCNSRRIDVSSISQTKDDVSKERKLPGRPNFFIPIQSQLSGSSQFISNNGEYDELIKMISIFVLCCLKILQPNILLFENICYIDLY